MMSLLKLDPLPPRNHLEGRVVMVLSLFGILMPKGEKTSIRHIRGICNGKSQARHKLVLFFDIYACELDYLMYVCVLVRHATLNALRLCVLESHLWSCLMYGCGAIFHHAISCAPHHLAFAL